MNKTIDETIIYGFIALKGLTEEFERFYKWMIDDSLTLPMED